MTGFGTITSQSGSHTVRFERTLEFTPDEVWAALTEPERLGQWLAPAEVVPGRKGEIALDFGDDGREKGRITAWDPPRLLEYEWTFSGERPSHVRWDLAPAGDGSATRLRLEHRGLEHPGVSGYGAGWHAHLDRLEGHLAGSVPSWDERFAELRPHYAELAGPTA